MAVAVLALLLAVILFPWIKRVWERYSVLRALRKICRLKRYSVKLPSPIGAYFRNYCDPCAFTVDTGKTLYAVSFWSESFANTNLIFTKSGNVIRRKKMADPFSFSGKPTHKVSEKRLINLKKRSPILSDSRRIVPLLLVFSKDSSLFFFENGQLERIKAGDLVYDMRVITKEALIAFIGK